VPAQRAFYSVGCFYAAPSLSVNQPFVPTRYFVPASWRLSDCERIPDKVTRPVSSYWANYRYRSRSNRAVSPKITSNKHYGIFIISRPEGFGRTALIEADLTGRKSFRNEYKPMAPAYSLDVDVFKMHYGITQSLPRAAKGNTSFMLYVGNRGFADLHCGRRHES
jgi:hypothetical protein